MRLYNANKGKSLCTHSVQELFIPTKGTAMDIHKWNAKTCTSSYNWLTRLLECCSDTLNGRSLISLLDSTAGTPHCPAATKVTRLKAGQLESSDLIPGWGRYLLLQQLVHARSGTPKPPIQWARGLQRPGREADNASPSTAEIRTIWSYTSIPDIPIQVCLYGVVLDQLSTAATLHSKVRF